MVTNIKNNFDDCELAYSSPAERKTTVLAQYKANTGQLSDRTTMSALSCDYMIEAERYD